jgi:hypothetical protein
MQHEITTKNDIHAEPATEANLGYPELALFALAVMTVIVFFLR